MSRAVSHIAIYLACCVLIAGSAWGQQLVPLTCPFVKVIETADDVSWVDVRSVTGIAMTPDRSYRYGKSWYSSRQDGDEPDELREVWVVAFIGTGIEARYPTRQEAGAAVDKVLTTAGSRGWQ